MEKLLQKMQDEKNGVPVRTVKSFMSKVPSVFTGEYLRMNKSNLMYSFKNKIVCMQNILYLETSPSKYADNKALLPEAQMDNPLKPYPPM